MARSQWHRLYVSAIAAPPELLFKLLSDLPNYPTWLPGSSQYGATTDVEPYPVQRGSRYHDGKPGGWKPVTVPHQSLPGSPGLPS